jgi:hypothetical protein
VTIGPLEFIAAVLPGTATSSDLSPELERLQKDGIIRILDLVFVSKDASGAIEAVHVSGLKTEAADQFGWLRGDLLQLLTADDLATLVNSIPAHGAAALLLFEHRWAVPLWEALQRAGGAPVRRLHIGRERLAAVAIALAQAQEGTQAEVAYDTSVTVDD